jgi:hypothetical protein
LIPVIKIFMNELLGRVVEHIKASSENNVLDILTTAELILIINY